MEEQREKEEIIGMNKEGERKRDRVKKVTNIKNLKPAQIGHIVSDGQTQGEVNKIMDELVRWYPSLANGIGVAKIEPIHIAMKKNVCPSAQKQRSVPLHLMEPLKVEVESLKKGVIDGPLRPKY